VIRARLPALKIWGVRIGLNPLFLLVIGLSILFGRVREALLFLSVLLSHDLAHVLVALGYGATPEAVEFLPFGSRLELSGLEGIPEAEVPVALAGPLHNFLLLALGLLVGNWECVSGDLFDLFTALNLAMALVNLLPVFPLDGGRIVRSYLAGRIGYVEATRRLSRFSLVFGLLMSAGALLWFASGHTAFLTLPPLGIMIAHTSWRELRRVPFCGTDLLLNKRAMLDGKSLCRVEHMATLADRTVDQVVGAVRPGGYLVLWVLDDHRDVKGILTEEEIRSALAAGLGRESLGRLVSAKRK